jgi:predicted  nucleic acid-binding Zn-ribbon protein
MRKNLITPEQDDLDPAARAFEALRDEVADLRHAINHLAQHVETIPTQDYRKTLAEILRAQDNMSAEIKDLKSHPAISLTPEIFLQELEKTKDRSLQKERKSLNTMEDTLRANSNMIGHWIEQARAANIQNWRIIQVGCLRLILGGLLIFFLTKK